MKSFKDMNFFVHILLYFTLVAAITACGGGDGGGTGTGNDGGGTTTPTANVAPTISGDPSELVNINTEYSFIPVAQDTDGDSLTFTVINKPEWLSFNSATGQLSGTPTDQDAQNYSAIKVTVSDPSGASASLSEFDILVNSAPVVALNAQSSYVEGSKVTISGINSYDIDGHDFSYIWQQTDGPTVNTDNNSQSSISFSAPLVDTSINVTLSLTLTDAYGAVSSETFVFIINPDDVAPTVGDFILLNSTEPTQATLAWLSAIDNATPDNLIQYQLHASEIESFTPTASTQIGSYQGETSATVTGLTASTHYYFKLIAIDGAGNETIQTNYGDLTTVSVLAVRTSEQVNEATTLNLGTLEISGTDSEIYAFKVEGNTVEPEIGSFLIGEDSNGEGYLRKVLSINNDQTTITLETSQGSLADILESGAMSSKLHLRSVAEEQVTAQPLASRKLSATIINKTQSPLSWKNNLLTITETGALAKRSKLASQQRLLTVRSVNAPKSNPIDIEASVGITLKGEFLFEPQLTSDIEWDYFSIERYETTVTGHFSFDGSVEFDFAGSATIDDPMKKVFTRTFTSKYVIGGVPVYQETTLTLNVKFTAKAETAIKATVNNHLSAQISINTLYENGQWQETSSRNFDKSLTVTAQVQGSVSAEIRLIPEVKVRFYKVASLAVRVEPFLNGEIAAEAVTQVNLIDEGFLSEYSFTKFDSFVGVDVNFYTDLKIFSKEIARYPKTGLKKLYEKKWQLFGLPKLEVSLQGAPNIHGPMTMTGKTTPFKNAFGYENTIDSSSLRWSGFPANTSGTGLTFNWQPDSHGEIYSIYFIGNSIALGDFGQQYQIQEIDMRDSDGDGMPNAWEAYYDFDMNNSNDAAEDADQDEITNLDEYLAYTDPRGLSCTNYQTDHNYSAPPEGGTVEYTTESTLDFSKNVFTWLPRQDSSGTWKSYLNRRDEYYIDDPTNIEFVYDYLTFKEDMDTGFCWVTNVEKLTRYDVSGDLNQEFSYIAKQNADGSWWSIQAGTAFDYFPWGAVQRSYPYIAKQNDNGYWVSVQEGTQIAYSRYYDGLKESETPYIAKQSDNGNWVGVIAGTQVRYSVKIDNGTSENYIAQKAPYIAIKNSDGRWVSTVEGTVTDYYSDASKSYEINYIAKMNENGTWLGVREGTGTSYYENGAKWGETPYLAKQNDNGNWTSVIEGTATDYYQSGAISRLSIYINDVRISYCSFDDDGTPTGCITL